MLVPFVVGKKFFESQPQYSMPWMPRAYSAPELTTAVQENWSDEATAVGDFLAVRGQRRITAAGLSFGLSVAYDLSRTRFLRYSIKGITRFVPLIGWGFLAYDLYNLGEDLDLY